MGKWNLKLKAGILLLIFFFILSLIGPYMAPYGVDELSDVQYVKTESGNKLIAPPYPPSENHLFGTDQWGYDILSLLLYGAKYTFFTVLICAFLRSIIGGAFGLYFAVSSRSFTGRKERKKIPNLLSGFPVFIFVYFVLIRLNFVPVLGENSLILLTGTLIVILGINGVYNVVFAKTAELKTNLYVLASQTIGGSRWHIAKTHILPALKGQLMIIFVNEVILVLHLIGQLGIFSIFLGGTFVRMDPVIYISMTKEWAGLIGQFRSAFYYSPWVILFPLAAYLLLLFSFYLILQGFVQKERVKHRKAPII